MSEYKIWQEALEKTKSEDQPYRNGNYLTLDCGCTIWADPNWNEYALAAAIEEHHQKNHKRSEPKWR